MLWISKVYSNFVFLNLNTSKHIVEIYADKCTTGPQKKGAAWKVGGDRLIDPLMKMGDIPPTSISIKTLRLEAFQGLLLFLFRGEPRKIYKQLMVSGKKALLEYIKSTYWKRECLPCELVCFSQRWVWEMDVAVSEITENGGYVCSKGKVCCVWWIGMDEENFCLFYSCSNEWQNTAALTWVTVLIESWYFSIWKTKTLICVSHHISATRRNIKKKKSIYVNAY